MRGHGWTLLWLLVLISCAMGWSRNMGRHEVRTNVRVVQFDERLGYGPYIGECARGTDRYAVYCTVEKDR